MIELCAASRAPSRREGAWNDFMSTRTLGNSHHGWRSSRGRHIARLLAALVAMAPASARAQEVPVQPDVPAPGKSPEKGPGPAAPPTPLLPGHGKLPFPQLRDEQTRLKDILLQAMLTDRQPAIAAAVFDDQQIIASAVVGVRVVGGMEAVTLADTWHLGSVTKSITATMVGSLVESGQLKWDATLAELFPTEVEKMNEKYKAVKLSQLLRHHAGVPAFTDGGSPDFAVFAELKGDERTQRAEFVRRLLARGPVSEPGTTMFYSNAGYAIVAAAAERAAGKAWSALLKEKVFEPLGLKSAGFGWPASLATPDEPHGHGTTPLGPRAEPTDPQYKLPGPLQPAGDVHMSIGDFATYAQAHLKGLRNQPGLLRPETVQTLHTPTPGDTYACGWVIKKSDDRTIHWHNGSAGTFFALMTLDPEKNLGAVVVTNSGGGAKVCEKVTQSIMEMFEK